MEKKKFDDIFRRYTMTKTFKLKPYKNIQNAIESLQENRPKPQKEEEKKKEVPPIQKKVVLKSHTVKSLQEYSLDLKDEKDVIFIKRLEETGKLVDAHVRELPPMRDVLSYISKLPVKPMWFRSSQESIINSNNYKFPDMDVLTRDYIFTFMCKGKTTCNNSVCESERLGGFRIQILPTRESNWCYLCHLYYSNRMYYESLNRKNDIKRLFQLHYFMVLVDVEGEYRLDKCLDGEKDVKGLFGTFPLYNCNNYIVNDSKTGFIENDVMVFRLSQTVSSNQIGSSSITQMEKASTYTQ